VIPRGGLRWAAAAFAAGVLLNIDRIPLWVSVAAITLVAWRLLAAARPVGLPGVLARTLIALVLVAAVLLRFHTLNGLSAGTALLALMGAIKVLETRLQRDQYIVTGAAVFLLLAACLDRQDLVRTPLYLTQAWLCCAALAVVGSGSPKIGGWAATWLAGRTLLFAMPLALLLFVFLPRLPGSFWALPRPERAVTGLSDTMSPGSITELTSSYDVAFRAWFEGAPPPPQERYWRGPVLHSFDGFTWSRGRFYRQQTLEYLGAAYHYRIALEPTAQRWWFSLDTATGAPSSKAHFSYDYTLMGAESVTELTSYTLTSHTSSRSEGPLSAIARESDTSLPSNRNSRSRDLARKLRVQAGTDAAFVDSVLQFLHDGGFRYSLTPPALDFDSVDDFLFNTRLGFCGHYASAFVSLMRAGGVPARVVTGYLGGEWNPIGQYFVVRQSDAHAWAEVWLEGRGWSRVDPTAVVEPERLQRGILDLLPNAVSAPARFVRSTPWLEAALQRWDALNTWWNNRVVKFSYDDQLKILERLGFDAPGARELGWAFSAVLVTWLLWIAWQVGRNASASRPDRLGRVYARLCRKLARAGLARESHQGPLAYADVVSRRRPDLEPIARSLVMRYAHLRYGRPARDPASAEVASFEREVARFKVLRRPS